MKLPNSPQSLPGDRAGLQQRRQVRNPFRLPLNALSDVLGKIRVHILESDRRLPSTQRSRRG